ncbi:hypothetical protein B0J15DRAFT_496715, partial [Fusarium solani]
MKHSVPPVSLEVFIIYYPHWLRFHEVYKLSRYTHPHRFIQDAYRLDQKRAGPPSAELRIQGNLVDAQRIKALVQTMRSKTPSFSPGLGIPTIQVERAV